APYPTVGGFLRTPDQTKFPALIERLEKIRPQVLRGIKTFYDYKQELLSDSDFLCLRNGTNFDFIEGEITNSDGKAITESNFHDFLKSVVVPYSQSEGYLFSDEHDNYLVGSLARINFNKDLLNPRTKTDTEEYLGVFPSKNVHHNNLAQAIEILQCVDDSLDILKSIKVVDEKPVRTPKKQELVRKG
ncbi:MAG: Nickel-dependent hydrogenase large subunit, partial [candidate division WWE3 bacterium GW2011_GWB2_43_22]